MLVLWAGACGDDPVGPTEPPEPSNRSPVAGTTIPAVTVEAGKTLAVELATHFSDPDGDALSFKAATSDSTVATASVEGSAVTVAGVATGEATITAAATDPGGLSASQSFAVAVTAPPIGRIVVAPGAVVLTAVGDTVRLVADAFTPSGVVVTDAELSWSSSDPTVASVDRAGLVTATGRGEATIIAAGGEASGEAVVSVVPSADVVTVTPSVASIAPGDELQLAASVVDGNGYPVTGAELSWTSSDPRVATARASGIAGIALVRGIGEGSATITASSGHAQDTVQLTVTRNRDHAALVALYAATDGPNWENSANWLTDAPLGSWYGVQIDGAGRVTRLALSDNDLTGPIPPEIGSLARLQELDLAANELTGPVPAELGALANLEQLDLHNNRNLTGPIPPELGLLANLRVLDLRLNRLTGSIPTELASLANLRELYLGQNELTGSIPAQLGSLSNLELLVLSYNRLTGSIPPQLASLASLSSLSLSHNDLTDVVPAELGGLTLLTWISLESNDLTGPVPQRLLELAGLRGFLFGGNDGLCAPGTSAFVAWLGDIQRVEGPFCNAGDISALTSLHEAAGGSGWTNSDGWLGDASLDEWFGVTADPLGRVVALDLGENGLVGDLPATLARLDRMTALRIDGNALSGRLPLDLARLPLREFHYADTELCAPADAAFQAWLGRIELHRGTDGECGSLSDRDILVAFYHATGGPDWRDDSNWLSDAPLESWHGVDVDGEGRVTRLLTGLNNLAGSIPPELGSLSSLYELFLAYNDLTGPIPPELGSLANLEFLYLNNNDLMGPIPPELGSLSRLRILGLGHNNLTGPIPPALASPRDLFEFTLNDNDLTGPIPPQLGNLARLEELDFAGNRLTGPIPAEIGNLARLKGLLLQRNDLTGPIPTGLGRLGSLERLMLSGNALTGAVPPEIGNLGHLAQFSLFGNSGLSGALPGSLTGLERLREFFAGGTGLCAPGSPGFLEWLHAISATRVALCGGGESMAYLIQATQSREYPVPLVANREALLRVFVTAMRPTAEGIPPVRARFYRDGNQTYVANIPGQTDPIPTGIDESSLSGSADVRIPGHIVQPGLEIVIEVDPDGTLDPSLGVSERIPETGRLVQDVRTVPPMDLTLIPFLWTEDPDPSIVDIVREMAGDPERRLWPVQTLLPVDDFIVTGHEPVRSSTNSGFGLRDETEMIRVMEGGQGYYMGLSRESPTGLTGVAFFGGRSSWSVADPGTMAHELGHNLTLQHAPCGGAGGPDPAFPESDGGVGVWGYDFRGEGRVVDASTPDLMAYCRPYWVSDYHFANALRYRVESEAESGATATTADPVRSLLVWGGVDAAGDPFLEPALVVDVPPVLPSGGGDYQLTGETAEGRQLFSLSFAMPDVGDGDGSSGFAFALPAEPGWADSVARITLSGPGGFVTLDGESDRSVTILRDPRSGQVHGIFRDLPEDARTWADMEEALAPRAALEVMFGRGVPDAGAWRR